MDFFENFFEISEYQVKNQTEKMAYCYLGKQGKNTELTFGELGVAAKGIAANLQRLGQKGDRVLIICPQSMDYVKAFWGCLYSGLVAVPAYAPRNNHNFERLETILKNAETNIVLLSKTQLTSVQGFMERSDILRDTRLVVVDEQQPDWVKPDIGPEDIAFLQYTSGSTSAAKGVMVTHKSLMANEEMIKQAFGNSKDTKALFWIPLFHDMGLMTMLQGVYAGYSSYLMTPMDFLSSPYRWLKSISEVKATLVPAPNFAYQLCIEKITPEQRLTLDLSCLKVAVNGSEPINIDTLENFSDTFSVCGFQKESFKPCYGLAEATLLVTASSIQSSPAVITQRMLLEDGSEKTFRRLGCGLVPKNTNVVVVNNETNTTCVDGEVGEIWIKGEHVAQGYWNNPEASKETFGNYTKTGDGPFLRSGDLGFFENDELVVTGRIKDLIIIRGDNYYPSDIEQTCTASHEHLVADGCAAFTQLSDDQSGFEENLQIVAEVKKNTSETKYNEIFNKIIESISVTYGLRVAQVMLIKERSIAKTSSGKIQRAATKSAWHKGELKCLSAMGVKDTNANETVSAIRTMTETVRLLEDADDENKVSIISGFVLSTLAQELKVPFYSISIEKNISALGLDSIGLMEVKQKIEAELDIVLPVDAFFEDSPLAALLTQVVDIYKNNREESAERIPVGQWPIGVELPASVGQSALWFIQQSDKYSSHYNEGLIARIEGNIQKERLEQSLKILSFRHDALRCTFKEVDGQLIQIFGDAPASRLLITHAMDSSQAFSEAQETLIVPFDLGRETWRCHIIESEDVTYLTFVIHHMIFDMWSLGVFLQDLQAIYSKLVDLKNWTNTNIEKDVFNGIQARQYADYSQWHMAWLASDEAKEQLSDWQHCLDQAPQRSTFPTSNLSVTESSFKGHYHRFSIDKKTLIFSKKFAQDNGFSLYQLLFGAFSMLLGRYSNQADVVVGMPVYGRPDSDFHQSVGYFVNVLPVRVDTGCHHQTVVNWLSGDTLTSRVGSISAFPLQR